MRGIMNARQLRITMRWAKQFKKAANSFPNKEAEMAVIPVFWKSVRNGAGHMYKRLTSEINTYLWKKKRNWVK